MDKRFEDLISQFRREFKKIKFQLKGSDCLSDYQLVGHIFDTLPSEEKTFVDGHLKSCFYCMSELTRIELELKEGKFISRDLIEGGAKSLWEMIKESIRIEDTDNARKLIPIIESYCNSAQRFYNNIQFINELIDRDENAIFEKAREEALGKARLLLESIISTISKPL